MFVVNHNVVAKHCVIKLAAQHILIEIDYHKSAIAYWGGPEKDARTLTCFNHQGVRLLAFWENFVPVAGAFPPCCQEIDGVT
mmetsp:Transcript_75839/g.149960  ORF Transcript_75839/g.149960 Transcript_75839/m.149960 type:complete len:82 (+) Transcript_75839:719-964(+)